MCAIEEAATIGSMGALFRDRLDAGRHLAAALERTQLGDAVVVGLARGGVTVAAEVARRLSLPLDALAVRKIGYPFQPEYGIGAVTPGAGGVYLRSDEGLDDEQLRRVIEQAQFRREARRFLLPMKNQRPRHDDQRGTKRFRSPLFAARPARFQQRQNLNRLAEPHVVGQTAAETEALEEKKPAKPFALVAAQLAAKIRRRGSRRDSGKALELLAHAREDRVDSHLRLGGEQRVEQTGL